MIFFFFGNQAFISADIPLFKFQNPELCNFLETYTRIKTPDESTLQKSFVEGIYKETLENIRNEIGEGPVWVLIDETTDVEGRFVI